MSLFRHPSRSPQHPSPPEAFTGHMVREATDEDMKRIEIAVHMITATPPTDRALLGWYGWDGGEGR